MQINRDPSNPEAIRHYHNLQRDYAKAIFALDRARDEEVVDALLAKVYETEHLLVRAREDAMSDEYQRHLSTRSKEAVTERLRVVRRTFGIDEAHRILGRYGGKLSDVDPARYPDLLDDLMDRLRSKEGT